MYVPDSIRIRGLKPILEGYLYLGARYVAHGSRLAEDAIIRLPSWEGLGVG
jgi:hypothetical protein